jgi:hypothetical protein
MRAWLLATAIGGLGLSCCGCDSRPIASFRKPVTCILLGCNDVVGWGGELSVPRRRQHLLSFDLCRNEVCWSFVETVSGIGPDVIEPSLDGLWLACTSALDEDGSRLSLGCGFWVASPEFADGDVYSLTIRDELTGSVLIQLSKSVEYTPIYKSGPDCGATCHRASLS